jgi:hypothetical protein
MLNMPEHWHRSQLLWVSKLTQVLLRNQLKGIEGWL